MTKIPMLDLRKRAGEIVKGLGKGKSYLLAYLIISYKGQTGICFELHGKDRTARFCHSGWNEGFVALWNAYRFLGLGAVIMINSNQGAPMILEIERAIAREYDWPDYFPTGNGAPE